MHTLFFISLFFATSLIASPLKQFPEQFDVQLESPSYKNGVMTTTKGGVLKSQDLFVQARNISYSRGEKNSIEASEDLFMTYLGRAYKGDSVFVDLDTMEITVKNGCTESGVWYLGGSTITISKDGTCTIQDAYITSSENEQNTWSIKGRTVVVKQNEELKVEDVAFYFDQTPLFWLPSYTINLKEQNAKAPFTYRVRWGGSQGVRVGLSYSFSSFTNWKNKFVLDYSFKKGLGAGLVADYKDEANTTRYQSLWYIAQDKTKPPFQAARYRLQGILTRQWGLQDVNFQLMYDKLSDSSMKSDFSDHAIDDAVAGRTEARLWKTTKNWISSLEAQVRVNSFQNVKQELPLLSLISRPMTLGSSGLILNTKATAGYLNYTFAKKTPNVSNYHSTRCELTQNLSRNFHLYPFSLTPSVGYHVIQYSNSPQGIERVQAVGTAGALLKTRLVNARRNIHIVEPYARYDYISRPRVFANNHYVFDIEDGWAHLNKVRVGLFQHLMVAPELSGFSKQWLLDVYTQVFFGNTNFKRDIPKVWLNSTLMATPWTTYLLDMAWDCERNILDHFNIQGRFTLSEKIAFTLEYRKRSAFAWRKIDPENFIIDMTRNEKQLRHSEMSDQRQTIRTTFFWKISPALDFEGSIRRGFGRIRLPAYLEWDLSLGTLIKGALQVKFTYEKRHNDNRYYVSFGLGLKKPSTSTFKKIGFVNYDL